MRKLLLVILGLITISIFGFLIYMSCCFELFSNNTTLLKTFNISSNESLNIYHSPSNAVSQPILSQVLEMGRYQSMRY